MRLEKDSLGFIEVPNDAYYGAQSVRAQMNFNITGETVHPKMIVALVKLKKACAIANCDVRNMNGDVSKAIVLACDDIIAGQYSDQFITDSIQGGAGTSMNMNVNEVIANIAEKSMGGNLGEYTKVHPNDHVNRGQSTNDVIPTAGKLVALELLEALEVAMKDLQMSFVAKAKETKDVIKVGRTHLQDAVFISFGQIFKAYGTAIGRDIKRLNQAKEELLSINLGATAIGTEINAVNGYRELAVKRFSQISGYDFESASDLVDGTRHIDVFANIHSVLKNFSLSLSRICNDLRLMASGPRAGMSEITLPQRQPGSSIMPGKVNPVIIEVVNQVCFDVIGNDATISMAVEAGQMELNVFEPVLFKNLFSSLEILTRACDTLKSSAIDGLRVNESVCSQLVEHSLAGATALIASLGYDTVSSIASEAMSQSKSLREVVLDHKLIDVAVLDRILDPKTMIGGEIS
ncbi:MAG: aspartate ammonia-lyase [Erysipelothrix sp.]|nr:aspartate ammonia-lyase [Erysipelothrix sp.]